MQANIAQKPVSSASASECPVSQIEAVDIEISVVLGRSVLPMSQLLRMGRGAVIPLDASETDEVWILEKDAAGFSTLTRASELELVRNLVDQGLPLGGLWYSDYLDAR